MSRSSPQPGSLRAESSPSVPPSFPAGHQLETDPAGLVRCGQRRCRARIDRGPMYRCAGACGGHFCHRHLLGAADDSPPRCPACSAAHHRQRLDEVTDLLAAALNTHPGVARADVLADDPHALLLELPDAFVCCAHLGLHLQQADRHLPRARSFFADLTDRARLTERNHPMRKALNNCGSPVDSGSCTNPGCPLSHKTVRDDSHSHGR